MGNYISCTLSGPAGKGSGRGTKVIFPDGEVRRLYEHVNAAELMLEKPNFFLVNTVTLKIGRRFSALSADEDLEIGNVYAFFPMNRLNSIVTAADLGVLFMAANGAAKKALIGSVRVSPEISNQRCSAPKLNLDDIEEFCAAEFRQRLALCRSKKPLLETIVEETISLR